MGNIGSDIATGAFDTLLKILMDVPWTAWLVVAVSLCAGILVIRVVTEWKIALALVIIFFVGSEILAYRAHWINQGKAEAEAEGLATKKTLGLVIDCYSTPGNVWDRTVGKCLPINGSN